MGTKNDKLLKSEELLKIITIKKKFVSQIRKLKVADYLHNAHVAHGWWVEDSWDYVLLHDIQTGSHYKMAMHYYVMAVARVSGTGSELTRDMQESQADIVRQTFPQLFLS